MKTNNHRKKVAVIGLDCAEPSLVFEKWINELPNIKKLKENSIYGKLKSTHPPITVPAWMSMVTGKDPGQLGIYGFRNRKDYSYNGVVYANSGFLREKAIWDYLGECGKKSILLGIPMTYPPRPVNGCMVSGFLTPGTDFQYTYPDKLKKEIRKVVGDYKFDVENFSPDKKDNLLGEIYEMTQKRFKLAEYFIKNKEWDFFMMVEMGVDRIHHGFWKHHDTTHPGYVKNNKYRFEIKKYYKYLDKKIGELLFYLDDVLIFIVSDHGVKKMIGGIAVNEWLIREGYLTLKQKPGKPGKPAKLKISDIDFKRTKAWGLGGYYSRIFMNVKGREESGIIPYKDYEKERNKLCERLGCLRVEDGRVVVNRVFKPHDIYRKVKNIPPDLLVYFDDLNLRSVNTVGTGSVYTCDNNSWPYDANHSLHGMYLMYDRKNIKKSVRQYCDILDIAPAILHEFGIDTNDFDGSIISKHEPKKKDTVYKSKIFGII